MAVGAGLVERHHRHHALVLAVAMTRRAGLGDAPRLALLAHFREVLAEMAGMVIDDPCAAFERIVVEFRVIAIKAVELHHMAGAALLVGDLAEIETPALVLLMAGRAIKTARDHTVGRESDALRHG